MLETEVKKLVKALEAHTTVMANLTAALNATQGTLPVNEEVVIENGNPVATDHPVPSDPNPVVPGDVSGGSIHGNGATDPTDPMAQVSQGPMLNQTTPAPAPSTPMPGQPTGNLEEGTMITLAKASQILNDPFLVNNLCKQVGVASVGQASPEQAQWMVATATSMVQAAGRSL